MHTSAFLAPAPLAADSLSSSASNFGGSRIVAQHQSRPVSTRPRPARTFVPEIVNARNTGTNVAREKRVKPQVIRQITFDFPEGSRGKVYVCQHSICHKQNSEAALAWFKDLVPEDIVIERGPCLGHCAAGPNTGFLAPNKDIVLVTGADSSLKMREALNREFGVTVSDALVDIIRLKQSGNRLFSANRNKRALEAFNEALKIAEDNMNEVNVPRMRAQLLSNRSAVHLAMEDIPKAEADADAVVEASPAWWKGYARKAEALVAAGKVAEAKDWYMKAAEKSNGDAEVLDLIKETLADLEA